MLYYSEEEHDIKGEQVSFILGSNFIISFQETEGDVFDMVRERLRKAKGRIRTQGADYLLYALMDAVIDGYFAILEKLGDKIEAIEGDLYLLPNNATSGFLAPEIKEIDFFMLCTPEMNKQDEKDFIKALNQIEIIQTAYAIDPNSLKSKDNFLIF